MLIAAAVLTFLIGLAHSYLGERYIIIRLLRRDNLPHLFGSDLFTKKTLRFAWHITTVAWWGLAAILVVLASPIHHQHYPILLTISLVFFISGSISLWFSKGKHFSWVVFFAIAALTGYAAF